MSNRKDEIKQYILLSGEVTLAELERMYGSVSSMTLRRDLIKLEQEGYVRRTRGGAVALNRLSMGAEGVYSQRAGENTQSKQSIAQKAIELLGDVNCIFLDSGSSVMYVAQALPDRQFSIMTSGINIAMELLRNPKYSVIMLGGQLNPNTLSASGQLGTQYLDSINVDTAIMATSGFDFESGFTGGSHSENELKRKVIAKAKRTIMLMDSNKIGRSMPLTFARLSDIDILVTDCEGNKELAAQCKKHKVLLITI